jgi:hypothetical protein
MNDLGQQFLQMPTCGDLVRHPKGFCPLIIHGGALMYGHAVCTGDRFLRIAEAANERLRNSPYRPLRDVLCECDWGVLLLRGRLPSFYHKQLAQQAVAGVKGVSQIINQIEVG